MAVNCPCQLCGGVWLGRVVRLALVLVLVSVAAGNALAALRAGGFAASGALAGSVPLMSPVSVAATAKGACACARAFSV